jgi:hypothetical protein
MRSDAGVIYENIEAAEFSASCFECTRAEGSVRYVAGNAHRTSAKPRYLRCDFLESILTPGDENQIDALPRQFKSERATDSARSTGDQRAPIS